MSLEISVMLAVCLPPGTPCANGRMRPYRRCTLHRDQLQQEAQRWSC
ncbi:MAG TPA: hypothetical protein ACQGQW_04705 [Xylella fastidiosa subsp. pauca]